MAAEVAHRPVAEVPPAVPLRARHVDVVERAVGSGAEPQVPVQPGGHRVDGGRTVLHEDDVLGGRGLGLARVPSPGTRDPHVTFADRADHAALDQLDDAPVVVAGVNLGAHLRRDAGLRRSLADDARLVHVVGERLLAVDVLLQLQRGQRGERVRVLGGADDDGVELIGVVEHLAEVLEPSRLREHRRGAIEVRGAHVAQGHDPLAGDALQVRPAASADADDGDAQAVRRLDARGADGCARDARARAPAGEGRRGCAGGGEERTAGLADGSAHGAILPRPAGRCAWRLATVTPTGGHAGGADRGDGAADRRVRNGATSRRRSAAPRPASRTRPRQGKRAK